MPQARFARAAAALALAAALAAPLSTAAAQSLPTSDSVLARLWRLGTDSSRVEALAQALTDSVGPRLTGTPGQKSGNDWLLARYAEYGIPARAERYGTWRGWRRGVTHVDLVEPRVRTLDATMLAWSPGTKGRVEAPVTILPALADSAALAGWLPQAKGKFVAVSFPQPSCRPDSSFKEFARPETWERHVAQRDSAEDAWNDMVERLGGSARLHQRLVGAGARGLLTTRWSGGWGAHRIFGTRVKGAPVFDLGCEDYGLVARLAARGQGPVLRAQAEAEELGEVPVFNVIGEIKGAEKPDEYVMLSAHFDSWDGSSGATDNATGTVTMLEAMRLLKRVYPRPKRTIVVGHWSGEEQGLNGSRAFAADHPEIVKGLQALFNQDNGTGRVRTISMQGLTAAGGHFGRWFARLPSELTEDVELRIPGTPGGGGSDYASFVCHGAPAFSLSSLPWEYGSYTWHTNLDTFDKIVVDEVRGNAILTAMLVYLASEDPETIARDRRVMPADSTGRTREWPACRDAARTSADSDR
jgi:hypothetical protein